MSDDRVLTVDEVDAIQEKVESSTACISGQEIRDLIATLKEAWANADKQFGWNTSLVNGSVNAVRAAETAANKLKERERVAIELFRSLEWAGYSQRNDSTYCVCCGGDEIIGHGAECQLAAFLSGFEKGGV
jgi:hypothetical protein